MGNIFFGLLASLSEALDAGDADAVAAVLARNVYAEGDAVHAPALAQYLLTEAAKLADQPEADIIAGRLEMGAAA